MQHWFACTMDRKLVCDCHDIAGGVKMVWEPLPALPAASL